MRKVSFTLRPYYRRLCIIAPVPPLPPRETPDDGADRIAAPPKSAGTEPVSETQAPNGEVAPPPPIKKTRTRKKTNAASHEAAEPGSVVQTESGETSPVTPPKRGRKKKTADEAGATVQMEVKTSPESTGRASHPSTASETDALPAKPKRTRRVGAHQPIRYPVGEQDTPRD
jgi:hypothetical protein